MSVSGCEYKPSSPCPTSLALSTRPTTEKMLSMLASAHPSVDDFANQPKYRIFSRLKITDSLKNNRTVSECTEHTFSEQ